MIQSTSDEKLKSYLAGLIEGDGSFITPLTLRDSKKRLRYPKIKIAFALKDEPLAQILQSYYGGHILIGKLTQKWIVWNITSKNEILSICYDINGYLRTPKINDFKQLITFLKQNDPTIQFQILPLDNSSIGSNAWLAGFVDADGNFNINITNKKRNKKRVQIQFRIEIKQFYSKKTLLENSENYTSFAPICNKIAQLFNLGYYTRVRTIKNKEHYFILICSTSLITNGKIVNYFNNFPLFSSKYLDYKNWETIYTLQTKKLHLTQEGINKCHEILLNHNSTRHIFSWNHLNNFYL